MKDIDTKDIVILLFVGVVVFLLWKVFRRPKVIHSPQGNVYGGGSGSAYNPAQLTDPRNNNYLGQGGPAPQASGTSGAQDFQAIAGGIAALGGAAAKLGDAFGSFGSAGTGGDYGSGSDSGGYSDGYDGGGDNYDSSVDY